VKIAETPLLRDEEEADNVAMELMLLIVLMVASFALAVAGARSVLGLVLHLMTPDEAPAVTQLQQ
jgi:hypothetical protein